jgi:alanine racemase
MAENNKSAMIPIGYADGIESLGNGVGLASKIKGKN